jgi:hypothetical protein
MPYRSNLNIDGRALSESDEEVQEELMPNVRINPMFPNGLITMQMHPKNV